jgi:phenylalanyl-tRNA synthetase beta chain
MKFTLSWLKEHLDTTQSLQQICETLTAIGLEVEDVTDPASFYAPFKAVKVREAVQHPNADRLKVCQVETEAGLIQVVCGAPNARSGMTAIYAPEGSKIPHSGLILKKTKIRDVESNGMLVSLEEMALSEDSEGIIEVADTVSIGTALVDVLGLNDPVIEINLTPNRSDCASVRGIARDLAAAGCGSLRALHVKKMEDGFSSAPSVSIAPDVLGDQSCSVFYGRLIKNVSNKSSPAWLQQKLKAVGQKPISALVDITNYLCLGLGRPLHVFDADKLQGSLQVRFAKPNESFEALNSKVYNLNETMVAVCDDSGVLGLGGIIGGQSSAVDENTKNVFVECALFDPLRIARAGRALQIHSDARYRFERGVDPASVEWGIEIATQMILDLCGGEAGSILKAGHSPDGTKTILLDPQKIKKLCGMDVPYTQAQKILTDLGFDVQEMPKQIWQVKVPSFRPDIEGQADLVEEVVRIVGLDHLPALSLRKNLAVTHSAETQNLTRTRLAKLACATAGYQECVTWSFLSKDQATLFAANDEGRSPNSLALTNPIAENLAHMRPSILPNLLDAAKTNLNRGQKSLRLFEVGPIFETVSLEGQKQVCGGIRVGSVAPHHWMKQDQERTFDVFDAKADALRVLEACGFSSASFQLEAQAPSWYHPGRSGSLKQGNVIIGRFGEIHPAVLQDLGIKENVVAFEIYLSHLPQGAQDAKKKKAGTAKPLLQLSPYPAVERDFAFVVDQKTQSESFVRLIKTIDRSLIQSVTIFDVFEGGNLPAGKKSIALSVTLQSMHTTLTDAEIENVGQKIVETAQSKLNAVLR